MKNVSILTQIRTDPQTMNITKYTIFIIIQPTFIANFDSININTYTRLETRTKLTIYINF